MDKIFYIKPLNEKHFKEIIDIVDNNSFRCVNYDKSLLFQFTEDGKIMIGIDVNDSDYNLRDFISSYKKQEKLNQLIEIIVSYKINTSSGQWFITTIKTNAWSKTFEKGHCFRCGTMINNFKNNYSKKLNILGICENIDKILKHKNKKKKKWKI